MLAFFVKLEIINKSTLISLYYSLAYPYFIYFFYFFFFWGGGGGGGGTIITCSPCRAHSEPLYFANKVLNVCDINDYIIGTFMYECLYGNIPDIFRSYFQRNADVHDHNLRNANDLHVLYGRLDIRKFSIKIAGANLCNSLPLFVKKKTRNRFISLRKIWDTT